MSFNNYYQSLMSTTIFRESYMRFYISLNRIILFLVFTSNFIFINSALATYPERPLTIVLGYTPGGAADAVSRIIAQGVSEILKQPVVVENKPGAAGALASQHVARSAPDGYTLLLVSSANTIASSIFKELPYNLERDFSAVMQVTRAASYVLLVKPSLPIKNVREFISYAKENPRNLTYASAGWGGGPHLAGALLSHSIGAEMTHIPYKGGSPAMLDVMRGEVTFYFSSVPTALASIKAEKVRAVGMSGKQRSAALPNVPTLIESGVKDFDISSWYGIVVPAKTPRNIIKQLNTALTQVLANPDVQARLAEQGEIAMNKQTPDEFLKFMHEETKKYSKVIEITKTQKE